MQPAGRPAAIGFDLGETLLTYAGTPLSWAGLYGAALTVAAQACAHTISGREIAAGSATLARYNTRLHPRSVEVPAKQIFAEIVRPWSVASEGAVDRAVEAFFTFFQQRLVAYPETLRVMSDLSMRRVPIGILTDVPYGMPREFVDRDLIGAGLNQLEIAVVTSVEIGFRKPEPAGFLALAQRLAVPIDQLWFVGNEEKDIVGARAAGAVAVLIDREAQAPSWGQHRTIRSLAELLD